MPPNLEVQIPEEDVERNDNNQITILLSPLSDYSSASSDLNDVNLSDESLVESSVELPLPDNSASVPVEQTFRDFLIKITNTEDLSTVTKLKLRVISRDVTLQYLSVYTPALRELTLDGSDVFSLRDLGGGLKNLKILKVNRCGLTCIDGVFGIEHLEELYATDNEITTVASCAFLPELRVIDLRRNMITMENLGYLNLCENIEELYVEGNPGIYLSAEKRRTFRQNLPKLKILDGRLLADVVPEINEDTDDSDFIIVQNNNNMTTTNQEQENFRVEYPPRVVLQRYFNQ